MTQNRLTIHLRLVLIALVLQITPSTLFAARDNGWFDEGCDDAAFHITKIDGAPAGQELVLRLDRGYGVPLVVYLTGADWLEAQGEQCSGVGKCEQATQAKRRGTHLRRTFRSEPMHFTGKERDSESGLDNFGARYDSSQYGRFMTPDPMLNSGYPSSPQTWNRYTYALNNPLVITDPTGLYNNIDHCGDGDKQCEKQLSKAEEKERKNVERLTKAVDKMKDGPEKARLQASLKAFGTANDENNVYVSYGGLDGNVSAQTGFTINPTTGAVSFNVAFDPSKNSDMAIDTAHEGTHITNKEDPRYNNPATTLSAFSDEYRAYQSSAWAASALGLPSLSYGGGYGIAVGLQLTTRYSPGSSQIRTKIIKGNITMKRRLTTHGVTSQ